MYYLKKRLEIAGAHFLKLNYDSKCNNLHGHNWIITVFCKNDVLNHNGMIIDFSKIKDVVMSLDHSNLNKLLVPMNPTAENIAKWICDHIPFCYKVSVEESENNIAIYEVD
jgi:6-pyruvoyltetrahydropterin/6-carboxytetrahydropterin synthase